MTFRGLIHLFVIAFVPIGKNLVSVGNITQSGATSRRRARRGGASGRAGSVSVVIVLQCALTPLKDAGGASDDQLETEF